MTEEPTPVEQRFLNTVLRRLRSGGKMIAGTFCEALVADALPGSVESDLGIAAWDLDWESHKIEVKATTVGRWNVSARSLRNGTKQRARQADVYILASHDGDDLSSGWEFYVVPTGVLNERGKNSITLSGARGLATPVALEELPAAVRAAARP